MVREIESVQNASMRLVLERSFNNEYSDRTVDAETPTVSDDNEVLLDYVRTKGVVNLSQVYQGGCLKRRDVTYETRLNALVAAGRLTQVNGTYSIALA
jgi:hypothetical protein